MHASELPDTQQRSVSATISMTFSSHPEIIDLQGLWSIGHSLPNIRNAANLWSRAGEAKSEFRRKLLTQSDAPRKALQETAEQHYNEESQPQPWW